MERSLKKTGEGYLGDGFLVDGDGKSAFGNVESALCCALVVGRVVEDALLYAVCGDVFAEERVAVGREAELACQTLLAEDEGLGRKFAHVRGLDVLQVVVNEILNALVYRAQMLSEETCLLAVAVYQVIRDFHKLGVGELILALCVVLEDGLPEGCELQIDVLNHLASVLADLLLARFTFHCLSML